MGNLSEGKDDNVQVGFHVRRPEVGLQEVDGPFVNIGRQSHDGVNGKAGAIVAL